jgi:two-component system, cell cycle sensor histidine kinase and response regulator CckA
LSTPSEVLRRPGFPSPAGEEVRRTQERFQLAARATRDLLWDWDLVRGEIVWAGTTRPYFGLPPEQIAPIPGDQYRAWADRVHPDDLEATETASRAAIESGAESWEHEYRFRRADDSYAHILERAFIARDEAGRALRIVGAMRDVSTREMGEGTTRLAAIVASSSEAIVGKTLDGVVTSWNAAAERIFGYTEREMVGQSIFVLIPEELYDAERDLLERVRRGERVDFADTIRIRKDGTRIDIALTVSPIWDPSGVVVGASSIKREITERKRADAELVRREERYRALVQATTSIVWTADPEGRFAAAQSSWEKYTGQAGHEQEGFGWMDAIHPDDRESVKTSWIQARDRRAIWESRGGRLWSEAHQGHRHFVARAVPVIGQDGTVREWIGTVTDVEDRWLAEERLRQADRMELVGRLAGGIAHEANNQMTVILGAAEFLARAIRDEAARVDVDHIRRAAHRTAAITQQLLAFSRRQVLQPVMVDLNTVVTTIEPILQRALGEVSRVELRLAGDLGQVKADPGQLDQVLLNLALNARDAMPDGGTLTIETMNVTVDERHATAKALEPLPPGWYVALIVTDTGAGMEQETLAHIFEPFFTTKGVGEGTGLGLATVYGIVKQSGGFVSVHSEPGHGTSFRIYLPLPGVTGQAERTPSPDASGGGTESILVAEDEPAVRAIIARSLREYGYSVIEARDGSHALELAEGAPAPPDLVIADVVMPGMGGKQLAESLERRWSGIPVLFISGYTGLDAVRRGLMDEGREFMQKPLEPDAVATKARQILDARTTGSR